MTGVRLNDITFKKVGYKLQIEPFSRQLITHSTEYNDKIYKSKGKWIEKK